MSEQMPGRRVTPDLLKETQRLIAIHGGMLPYQESLEDVQKDMRRLWSELLRTNLGGDPEATVAARSLVEGYRLVAREPGVAGGRAEAYVQTSDFAGFVKDVSDGWGEISLETRSGLFYLEGMRVGLGATALKGLEKLCSVADGSQAGVTTVYLPEDGPL